MIKQETINPLLIKTTNLISQLEELLHRLSDHEFVTPVLLLDQATVGQHTRHILELFKALCDGYENAHIDYDNRARNLNVETSREAAIEYINAIRKRFQVADKELTVSHHVLQGSESVIIKAETTYFRELIYNIEHTIHHFALIKVGVKSLNPEFQFSANFGYADSTILDRLEKQNKSAG